MILALLPKEEGLASRLQLVCLWYHLSAGKVLALSGQSDQEMGWRAWGRELVAVAVAVAVAAQEWQFAPACGPVAGRPTW